MQNGEWKMTGVLHRKVDIFGTSSGMQEKQGSSDANPEESLAISPHDTDNYFKIFS